MQLCCCGGCNAVLGATTAMCPPINKQHISFTMHCLFGLKQARARVYEIQCPPHLTMVDVSNHRHIPDVVLVVHPGTDLIDGELHHGCRLRGVERPRAKGVWRLCAFGSEIPKWIFVLTCLFVIHGGIAHAAHAPRTHHTSIYYTCAPDHTRAWQRMAGAWAPPSAPRNPSPCVRQRQSTWVSYINRCSSNTACTRLRPCGSQMSERVTLTKTTYVIPPQK